jgi:tetratricopeptide (TPR) repeat protein
MATAPTPPAPAQPGDRSVLIAIVLAAAALVVYGQTLGRSFVFLNVDDPEYVTINRHVQQGLTPDGLRWALTTFEAYNWHPLTWLSLQLDYQLYGLSARGFHFTNVLLHALNTVLLFWLLRRMTGAVWCSAAVAAFFALHPTHVESVAWVAERKDVLSALFWLLTIAAYVWYAERPGWRRYPLVLLTFALALMAKPMVVTLPCVLLLLDYWPLRRWQPAGDAVPTRYARASVARLVVEKLPLFALVAASIPLTLRAQQEMIRTLEQIPISLRVENALVSYVQYIGMTFWPSRLAIFYPHPRDTIPWWHVLAAGGVLAVFTAAALWEGRRRPYLAVGWLWFLGTLVPVIGLVQVGVHALADRYTYLPSVGLLIVVAWGVADLVASRTWAAVPLALLTGALLVACAVFTSIQLRYWRNSEELWQHAVDVTTNNSIAREGLGVALRRQGRLKEARDQLRESLRISPGSPSAHGNLALVLEELGQFDEAAEQLTAALRIKPGMAQTHLDLGRVRERQGRLDDARREYAAALQISPNFAEAQVGLGGVLEEQGQLAEALEHYEAALRLVPDSAAVHNHLGRVLNRLGKPDEALGHYDTSLRIEPDSAETHNNKGVALESLGRLDEAAACYQRAVDLDPGLLLYRCNLAFVLHESGQSEAARAEYREALRLNSNWPFVALQEAWKLATSPDAGGRNGARAVRTARIVCQATDYRVPPALDVLAAAQAELGQFDEAAASERKALELTTGDTPPAVVKAFEERLRLYKSGKPFRESPAPPEK